MYVFQQTTQGDDGGWRRNVARVLLVRGGAPAERSHVGGTRRAWRLAAAAARHRVLQAAAAEPRLPHQFTQRCQNRWRLAVSLYT